MGHFVIQKPLKYSPLRVATLSVLILNSIFNISCDPAKKESKPFFTSKPPESVAFKNEIQYLELTRRLTPEERNLIEIKLEMVEEALGVPKALLWCVLFQESRFDPLKNATNDMPAKGIGQFTSSALDEINLDTDHFDPRTSSVLNAQIAPATLPIDLKLKLRPLTRRPGSIRRYPPEQPVTSYYNASTAIFASGIYLNNRYQQLKTALDHQEISYDPGVLWLYAAAAYNKGSRTVFLLLTNEYMTHGEGALAELLQSEKAAYGLLTHSKRLDHTLREIWVKKTRTKYIDELLRNMEVISSCALTERKT